MMSPDAQVMTPVYSAEITADDTGYYYQYFDGSGDPIQQEPQLQDAVQTILQLHQHMHPDARLSLLLSARVVRDMLTNASH